MPTDKLDTPARISLPRRKRRKRKLLRKPRISTHRFKRQQIKGIVPTLNNIPKEKLTNSVINLSENTTLSDHHILLFYLSHSFSPLPPLPNYTKFTQDILEFSYKLRWAYYFSKNNSSSSSNPEVTKMERPLIKSNMTKQIKTSHNHTLEIYLDMVSKELHQTKSKRTTNNPDNIPKDSRIALNEMRKWEDKIIIPADKGSKFFILNCEDYIERVVVHLQDPNTFQVMDDKKGAVANVTSAVKDWTLMYKNEPGMTTKLMNWVISDESKKPGNNYVNPKAHKSDKITLVVS